MSRTNLERFEYGLDNVTVPFHIQYAIRQWVFYGHRPGNFLCALFSLDFILMSALADPINAAHLADLGKFLREYVPRGAYGPDALGTWKGCDPDAPSRL